MTIDLSIPRALSIVSIEIAHTRTDLMRSRALITDAFTTLHRSALEQDANTRDLVAVVRSLAATGAIDGGSVAALARLVALSERSTALVADTVRALQFEDMTTQVLATIAGRVGKLEAITDALQAHDLDRDHALSEACAIETPSPVTQDDVTGGAIEIF